MFLRSVHAKIWSSRIPNLRSSKQINDNQRLTIIRQVWLPLATVVTYKPSTPRVAPLTVVCIFTLCACQNLKFKKPKPQIKQTNKCNHRLTITRQTWLHLATVVTYAPSAPQPPVLANHRAWHCRKSSTSLHSALVINWCSRSPNPRLSKQTNDNQRLTITRQTWLYLATVVTYAPSAPQPSAPANHRARHRRPSSAFLHSVHAKIWSSRSPQFIFQLFRV